MNAKRSSNDESRAVAGDPGVGGLLADPLGTDANRDAIDPGAGRPTADPALPRHHRDGSPNNQVQAATSDGKELPDA